MNGIIDEISDKCNTNVVPGQPTYLTVEVDGFRRDVFKPEAIRRFFLPLEIVFLIHIKFISREITLQELADILNWCFNQQIAIKSNPFEAEWIMQLGNLNYQYPFDWKMEIPLRF